MTEVRTTVPNRLTEFGGSWQAIGSAVAAVADDVRDAAGDRLDSAQLEALEMTVQRLVQRGLYVVVVGEFKAGKSNTLNAILGQRDVFPVDEDIATSFVTSVSYGDHAEARVVIEGEDAPRNVELSQVREYVTESCNPRNARRVRFVDIQGPFSGLIRGLTLLDTPGEGCLNIEHTAATLAIVPQADAVIVVVDAVEPVTTMQLEFIDTVRSSTTNMVFALTKCDLIVEPQVMVDNLRAKLTDRYGSEGAALPIIAVSSTRLLDGLEDDDPDLVADSGIKELTDHVWGSLLHRAAAAAVASATSQIRGILEQLVIPVQAELVAIREEPAQQAALRDQLNAAAEHLESVASPDATWRQRLNLVLTDLGATVESDLAADVEELDREIDQVWLASDDLLAGPEQIAQTLVTRLMQRLGAATQRVDEGLRLAYTEIDEDLQLDLRRARLQAITFDPCLLNAEQLAGGGGFRQRVRAVVRQHWDSDGLKAILRGLVGVAATALSVLSATQGGTARAWRSWDTLSSLNECSGDLVSSARDIGSGIRSVQDRDRTTRLSRYSDILHGYLDVNGRRATEALHDAVAALPYRVGADVEERIASEHRMVSDSLSRMQSASVALDPRRREELVDEQRRLSDIFSRLQDLEASVQAPAQAAGASAGLETGA